MERRGQSLDTVGAGLMVGRASGTHLGKTEVYTPITVYISVKGFLKV
jgi:hypothetical protein